MVDKVDMVGIHLVVQAMEEMAVPEMAEMEDMAVMVDTVELAEEMVDMEETLNEKTQF